MNKKPPERSCLVCRKKTSKQDFIRLVRTTNGDVKIDTTGKQAGRGAYVCKKDECINALIKSKRLENALKANVSADFYTELQDYLNREDK